MRPRTMLGILLVDKPAGISSHDVVNRVRRQLGIRRVGHAGTLDPTATGLLVVAVGPATRFLQYLPLEPKVYEAEIKFGVSTTTQDAEGEVVELRPVPMQLRSALESKLPAFLGEIHQIPPMFSALKKAGKPLYAYAREGADVARETRRVYVSSCEIEEVGTDFAKISVACSGGTYVRTLAHDLGDAIGCGAHLSALTRTSVGRFSLAEAIPLDEVSAKHMIPLKNALYPLPCLQLQVREIEFIRLGRAIQADIPNGVIALLDQCCDVFSVGRACQGILQPECVIPEEAASGLV